MGSPVTGYELPSRTSTLIWIISAMKAFGWLVGVVTAGLGALFVDSGEPGDGPRFGAGILAVVFVVGFVLIIGQVVYAMQERLDRLLAFVLAHAAVDAGMVVVSVVSGTFGVVGLYLILAAAQLLIARDVQQLRVP